MKSLIISKNLQPNGFTEIQFVYGVRTISAFYNALGKLISARLMGENKEIKTTSFAWHFTENLKTNPLVPDFN